MNIFIKNKLTLFISILILCYKVSFSHGDLHEQIVFVTEKINKTPLDANLFYKRANLYRLHKEFDLACKDIKEVKRLDKKINTNLMASMILFDMGKNKKALKKINRFLKKFPNNIKALKVQAEIKVQNKNYVCAIKNYQKIVKESKQLQPDDVYILSDLILLNDSLAIDEALEVINKGRNRIGDIISFDEYEYKILLATKNYKKAVFCSDKALSKLSRKENWLYKKAVAYNYLKYKNKEEEMLLLCKQEINMLPNKFKVTKNIKELSLKIENRLKALSDE